MRTVEFYFASCPGKIIETEDDITIELIFNYHLYTKKIRKNASYELSNYSSELISCFDLVEKILTLGQYSGYKKYETGNLYYFEKFIEMEIKSDFHYTVSVDKLILDLNDPVDISYCRNINNGEIMITYYVDKINLKYVLSDVLYQKDFDTVELNTLFAGFTYGGMRMWYKILRETFDKSEIKCYLSCVSVSEIIPAEYEMKLVVNVSNNQIFIKLPVVKNIDDKSKIKLSEKIKELTNLIDGKDNKVVVLSSKIDSLEEIIKNEADSISMLKNIIEKLEHRCDERVKKLMKIADKMDEYL